MLDTLTAVATHSFETGIRATAPVMVAMLLAILIVALISRTIPQLNAVAIGLNFNSLIVLAVFALTLGSAGWVFQEQMGEVIEQVRHHSQPASGRRKPPGNSPLQRTGKLTLPARQRSENGQRELWRQDARSDSLSPPEGARRRAGRAGQDLASAAFLVGGLLVPWYFGTTVAHFLGELARDSLGGNAWPYLSTERPRTRRPASLMAWPWPSCRCWGCSCSRPCLPSWVSSAFSTCRRSWPSTGSESIRSRTAADLFVDNAIHLGFGVLKVLFIMLVAGWSLWGERSRLMNLTDESTPQIAAYLFQVMLWTSLKIGGALVVLALFDYGYQYWKHEQDLRMTTQELKEEIKQQQGDPQVVARRRQIQRQMVLHRLNSTIPKADVIVTNPTQLAIALQYDHEKMAAPVVIAKGADFLAKRIRELACEHNVPIVERKELARVLYANVEIGQQVPAEQYAAVAEVVRYVYQLKGKKLPGQRAA